MKIPTIMKKGLVPVGYVWGIATALGGFALFIGLGGAGHALAQLPFMKIHPVYSGAEVVRTQTIPGGELRFHRPVFDGLIGPRKKGFVQVDVIPAYKGAFPMDCEVDYDADGVVDCVVSLPADGVGWPSVTGINPQVSGLANAGRGREGWIIRIGLDRSRPVSGTDHP